jgi:ribosomal protein S18 acetylase RimI-like enzyme
MIHIREYHLGDAPQVERCIVELQAFERAIEPNRADPETIAASYLAHILQKCLDQDGALFVAEAESTIVGFVCVFTHVDSGALIEAEREHAYVSDLLVLPAYRRQAIGRALLGQAEDYAARRGATVLKLDVLAANNGARAVYRAAGFQELEIRLQKRIGA